MTLSLLGPKYSVVYPKDLCCVCSNFLYILMIYLLEFRIQYILLFADGTKFFCEIGTNGG